ncbi:hypothetical protein [Floridanema aerugineum]|uniref:Uracil-DNA glycosylase n=1 Tax=Floridaenema aerugineum BLCC-F46 TaxID=3153654 RepID=A0ABV4X274_9CYAN
MTVATANPRHLSNSNEHFTPDWLLDAVREVLGSIDLDPASCEEANKRVNAQMFYDADSCGVGALGLDWDSREVNEAGQLVVKPANVFCNPPGGKVANKSQIKLFWNKLIEQVEKGNIRHALFLAFSVEALQSTQKKTDKAMLDFPGCMFKDRVAYVQPGGSIAKSPPHSSSIIYIPGTFDATDRFFRVFHGKLGKCWKPVNGHLVR